MKSSSEDSPSWDGTNSSGFSALPGGLRYHNGDFGNVGYYAYFWSSSPSGSLAWSRRLDSGNDFVYRNDNGQRLGFSVRCVRDCDDLDGDGVCFVDEVPGCMNEAAMNYDPAATDDDGSCAFSIAGCNGELTKEYGGYSYDLVTIGDQCWFAENLRSEHYRNGDLIPTGLTSSAWTSTTDGAQTPYNEAPAMLADYGRLYNGYAVLDERGLCPGGWNVATDEAWMNLEMAVGMSNEEALATGVRGTVAGNLKATAQDNPGWNGINTSGFTALPGGYRQNGGNFSSQGSLGSFWTSSLNSDNFQLWCRDLNSNTSVTRANYDLGDGASIRCIFVCDDTDGDGICNSDEVAGCTDATADNYNAAATDDDGSCIYPPFVNCGDGLTYQGHNYSTVAIGEQCWFAENLRSNAYANGDAIPGELTDAEWSSTTAGAQAVYGEGSSWCWDEPCDEVANLEDFGRLYNWYAVDDSRGLCPSGWHVPTDGEYMTLEMELGMSSSEANSTGWRGTDQGARIKASASDSPSWDGTNSSGFSALPGGRRYNNGHFSLVGHYAYFWSSSPSGSAAWHRSLPSGDGYVSRGVGNHPNGFSVRCVRD